MNITLHQLKVFRVVTQKGSVTKAAEELNMTQPAVSIQLKKMQDQFDIPLWIMCGGRRRGYTAKNFRGWMRWGEGVDG